MKNYASLVALMVVLLSSICFSQEAKLKLVGSYDIHFNYSVPLDSAIQRAKFDQADPYISSCKDCFPAPMGGEHWYKVEIYEVAAPISTKEAIEYFHSIGRRPVYLKVLLALATDYPDLQKEMPIVDLETARNFANDNFHFYHHSCPVPILQSSNNERRELIRIDLSVDSSYQWNKYFRFAVATF